MLNHRPHPWKKIPAKDNAKKNYGGARPGAGRKPGKKKSPPPVPLIPITIRLPRPLLTRITAAAPRRGLNATFVAALEGTFPPPVKPGAGQ